MGVFDDRRVTQASAYGIQFISDEPTGVSVTVDLGVSSEDGEDIGPTATIQIFVPAETGASLMEIQEEAVDRSLDLLERLVAEDRHAVKRLLLVPEGFDISKR